jgi:hypothetical protein
MSISITFDDLDVGTVVTDQYAASTQLTFTTPGTVASDGLAPSGPNVLQANILSYTEPEFPIFHIEGKFPTEGHSIISFMVNQSVVVLVYGYDGQVVASTDITVQQTDGSYVYGEVVGTTPNFVSFRIQNFTRDVPFSIDNFTFEDVSLTDPPPDFRLLYPGPPIILNPDPGQSNLGSARIRVVRFRSSYGPINLTVSSIPTAILSATITPNPVVGDDTMEILVIAKPWSADNPVVNSQSLVVTGDPSQTAGTTPHSVNIPVTVLEPWDAQIVGIEVTQSVQPMDLPQKNNPESQEDVTYTGVPLVDGGMTRARVFCAWRQPGRSTPPPYDFRLRGFRNGKELVWSPVSPEVALSSSAFPESDIVTLEMRTQQQVDFILPVVWTEGNLTLRAELLLRAEQDHKR